MSSNATPAPSAKVVLNGVDVTGLVETIEAIKETPALGESHFRAANRWIDGAHNRSTIKGFYAALQEDTSREAPFIMDNDEPPLLYGRNIGANPVEYLLHAAAGCVTTTFVYYAAVEGIRIDEMETTVEGDIDLRGLLGLDKNVSPEYQEIRFTFHVKSDAPTEKIEELLRLAEMRSPSYNSIAKPVKTRVQLDHKQA